MAKVCSHPGCPELQPCDEHKRKPWSGGDAEARAQRKADTSSSKWKRLRAQVLRRDPICTLCGTNSSTIADHIFPAYEGGLDVIENLRGICSDCDRKRSASQGAAARWA